MLTRFGWTRVRDARRKSSSRRSSRRLRLEALEQRTLMVGDLFFSLQGLFAINFPDGACNDVEVECPSSVEDGWDEGEDLVISTVYVEENGAQDTDGITGVSWKYVFTDPTTSEFFIHPVSLNGDPNVTVPWSSFVAAGIDDGSGFVDVTLTPYDEFDQPLAPPSDPELIFLENGAPTIANIADNPTGGACSGSGEVNVTATIGDPSPSDTLTMMIDWDLNDLAGPVPYDGNEVHTYAPGTYTVTITATDDDHANTGDGQTIATHQFTVPPGGPTGSVSLTSGLLLVTGSACDDWVHINNPSDKIRVSAGFLPGPDQFVEFPAASVQRIQVLLDDGNDALTIAGGIALPLIAVGGDGDDLLTGTSGRSILIGGDGADTLLGGRGEDVLVAGTTSHDANPVALLALLAEWASGNTLEERIRNLVDGSGTVGGGLNGTYFLTDGNGIEANRTVFEDDDHDLLTGGKDSDWLFVDSVLDEAFGANRDLIGDDLNDLFGP